MRAPTHKIELFSVFTPFDVLEKGGTPDEDPDEAPIGGICSAEMKDMQGETLIQKGMDFSYFLKHGWFNWEHQHDPQYTALGYGKEVRATTYQGVPATLVKGMLLLKKPFAKHIHDTASALQKSASGRRLGFSIEGAALPNGRDPNDRKRVLRSKVLNISITAHPIWPDASLEVLAKAAMIGYATPSSGGGLLGALVPQSIDGRVSLTQFGLEYGRGKIGEDELWRMIGEIFQISDEDARRIAGGIVRAMN